MLEPWIQYTGSGVLGPLEKPERGIRIPRLKVRPDYYSYSGISRFIIYKPIKYYPTPDSGLGRGLFRAPRRKLIISGKVSLSCDASRNRGEQTWDEDEPALSPVSNSYWLAFLLYFGIEG